MTQGNTAEASGARMASTVQKNRSSNHLRSNQQGPLEDTPDPAPTVSEGISFFVGGWGSLGYLPRVCGQNH